MTITPSQRTRLLAAFAIQLAAFYIGVFDAEALNPHLPGGHFLGFVALVASVPGIFLISLIPDSWPNWAGWAALCLFNLPCWFFALLGGASLWRRLNTPPSSAA